MLQKNNVDKQFVNIHRINILSPLTCYTFSCMETPSDCFGRLKKIKIDLRKIVVNNS